MPKSKSKKKVKLLKKRVTKSQKRQTTKSSTPAANGNPFRPESAYARIYDVLASAPEGMMTREDLLKKAMKAVHKDATHTGYDLAVILSPKDSPTGKRHRSCRPGYWVERNGDLLKLRTV